MTIRMDGEVVGPDDIPSRARPQVVPPRPIRPGRVSPETQGMLEAMSLCAMLQQPVLKRNVGQGELATPNPIHPYGIEWLQRAHARLEKRLNRYFLGQEWEGTAIKKRKKGKR